MTREELEKILNRRLLQIANINTNWTIWNGLRNSFQKGAEYEQLPEYSPRFWTVTMNNLLSKALLEMAKLCDEHRECMGLLKIINICEQNQGLFPDEHVLTFTNVETGEEISRTRRVNVVETIKQAKEKYQSVCGIREKLSVLRDKTLAHTDKDVFLDTQALYQKVSLQEGEFEELISVATDILKSFLSDLAHTVVSINCVDEDDYDILLYYVKKGKAAYLKEIRAKTSELNKS